MKNLCSTNFKSPASQQPSDALVGPGPGPQDPSPASDSPAGPDICAPLRQDLLQLPHNLHILAVDDNTTNLNLIQSYLRRMKLNSSRATSGRQAVKLALETQPDLILLDIMMPDIDGMEVCRVLKDDPATASIPIIFLSARKEVSDKVTGMAVGAVDYITKPFNPSELEIRIRSALRTKALQDKLSAQAKTDALTGLYNWRYFYEILTREVQRCRISSDPLSLILVDLDMFKVINDSYGHQMGDKVLCDLGALINREARPSDTVARYGGDELALVLPLTDLRDAKKLAQRLRQRLSQTRFGKGNVQIACSFGVAALGPGDKASAEALVRMADEALYAAKRQGRNRVCVWTPAHKSELCSGDTQTFRELYQMRAQVASINARSRKQAMESMWTLVKALEARDPYSAHHSENVMHYAEAIAQKMGLAPQFVQHIRNAAILHDVGKIGVPDRVLKKVGKLDPSEWELMKQHPLISAEILGQLTVLKPEVLSVRHHHEHFDGSGYPEGLAGKQIPIGARILAVADAFDAITSDRLYRSGKTRQQALDEIAMCAVTQFDPEVVQAFVDTAQTQEQAWPIRRSGHRTSARDAVRAVFEPAQRPISPDEKQEPDQWLDMQDKIEQALGGLAESFDRLIADRCGQDLNRLSSILSRFQAQASDLSSLAKSIPPAEYGKAK